MLNDRQRVELGLPIELMSRTMMHLREFKGSPTGVLVSSLMAKAAGEVLQGCTDREIKKHVRRAHRVSDVMLHALRLGPAETHLDNLQTFNAALAFANAALKLGLPVRGRIGYMQYSAFVTNLVAPASGELSLLGESVNDALITSAGQAMLGVAMSNGYYCS